MITRIHASVALALTLSSTNHWRASAFSRSSIRPPNAAFSTASSRVRPSSSLSSHAIDSEEDALWLMQKAEECANSDSCSIDDARGYLREVIHIQSGCVTGTLAGHGACDDVTFAASVVAGLREKIEKAGERNAVGSFAFASPSGSLLLQPANPWEAPLKATLIALACVYAASLWSNQVASNMPLTDDFVVPFTVQEWWWALRDGYLFNMLSEYAKHGGLMQIPSLAQGEAVVPFTAQEWLWAARDGYLFDMMGEYAKHGGLMVTDADAVNQAATAATTTTLAQAEAVVPFTAQEWFWAARDGYLSDMTGEVAKHGGLMVSSDVAADQAATVPMTAQEWMWSARDGYLGDAIKHVYRNGGL